MKFIKPFKGATGGDPYPHDFKVGDECPADLIKAAMDAKVIKKMGRPEALKDKESQ